MTASLFLVFMVPVCGIGQQPRRYPSYQSVSRTTEYDAKGEVLNVSTHTRYETSSGDWRVVSKLGPDEQATLYRRGKGVYQSNSRTSRIVKQSNHAPGCPLRTADELRRDAKFDRTEDVLGFIAYVLIDRPQKDLSIEHYFVPELGGGIPFKQITTYTNGPKLVTEPLSVIVGEPDSSDVTGPDYFTIEQQPHFVHRIADHLRLKPNADYPPEALNGNVSGVVRVLVTVDETGNVIMANTTGFSPQLLRQAAVEAAYKAVFNPIEEEGRFVVAKGIIEYQFTLAK